MTTTTPVVLLAPAPNMVFASAPSGWNYTADKNGVIVVTNGSVADIQALVGEGCTALSPSVQYTDLNYTAAVACATTAALPANSYANGTAGAGATLTGASNCALSAIDGVTPALGMRLWVMNEAAPAHNGLYVVTQLGGASTPYILTRSTDANTAALLGNLAAFVTGGAANIGNTYGVPLSFGAITVGTTAIGPVQVNGPNGVAAETARAESAEAGLATNASPSAANLVNDVIFPDDPYYAGGIFDGSGNPLFGLLPNGAANGVVVVPLQAVGDDPVWPDDVSTIEGDIGLADMNGNLVFPVTDAHINSLASALVAVETSRAESAEATLTTNTATNADEIAALQTVQNDVIFPDDAYYAGGIFDGSGNPLFGLLPNGAANGVVVVPPQAVGDDPVWPDDVSTIEGDIGLADMNGNLVFPVTDAHINSLASALVAVETSRAESAEATLTTNTATNADEIAALQTVQNDVIFPDDPYYAGGIFDGSGNPLFGLLPNGAANGVVSVPPQAVGDDPVWPDDVSTIEGDIGLADMNGNLLFPVPTSLISSTALSVASSVASSTVAMAITVNLPSEDQVWPDDVSNIAGDMGLADMNGNLLDYKWAPSAYNAWNTYADPSSNDYISAISPSQTVYPIASSRGANAYSPSPSIANCDSRPDSSGILRWTDNGTADGLATRSGGYFTPGVEFREFNFAGAASVLALSGITKIVFIPMIGQSLSNGTTASAFTTYNVFNRAFMFNGGPMPYQEFNSAYPAPGALCQDSQLQSLTSLVEINKPGGVNGETYGGGISYWLGKSGNLESTSALVYATLGQGGASYSANEMQQYDGSASNSMFASVIRCVERLAAWCALNGLGLEVPCIIHDQGENDYGTAAGTYYSDLVANQAAYNTAIAAVFTKFGLTNSGPGGTITQIPFLCIQPSSWAFYSDTTAPAMYEYVPLVVNNTGKVYLIGPQYWNANYNTSSGQHMTGLGYRQCAEYAGRAIKCLRAGLASEAVYATTVSNSGLTLTITFNTQSQLVHDTSVVSDPNGQWGIDLTANGNNVALSSPTIVGTNQIEFTLASPITGMSCVLGIADYAYGTLGQVSGPTTSARAPIHDFRDGCQFARDRLDLNVQLRLPPTNRIYRKLSDDQRLQNRAPQPWGCGAFG